MVRPDIRQFNLLYYNRFLHNKHNVVKKFFLAYSISGYLVKAGYLADYRISGKSGIWPNMYPA